MNYRRTPSAEPLDEYLVSHTPGPWYPGSLGGTVCSVHPPAASPHSMRNSDGEVRAYGGYLVCESVATKADAAVMAAAPDMEALLRKLHDWLAESATSQQALGFQLEIQDLFLEIWRMGGRP